MLSGPSSSRRRVLEEKAVALLREDVDRLAKATQSCISAGDRSHARENLSLLASKLHEVEELLRELDQADSPPSHASEEYAAPAESGKRDDRVFRAPCQACGQVYPLRLYQVGWRYRWLCYRCRQTQFPASEPKPPEQSK